MLFLANFGGIVEWMHLLQPVDRGSILPSWMKLIRVDHLTFLDSKPKTTVHGYCILKKQHRNIIKYTKEKIMYTSEKHYN